MKNLESFIVLGALAFAGIALMGCSNQPAEQERHDQGFAGGNGAFGETPRTAGDYSSRISRSPDTQPSNSGQ